MSREHFVPPRVVSLLAFYPIWTSKITRRGIEGILKITLENKAKYGGQDEIVPLYLLFSCCLLRVQVASLSLGVDQRFDGKEEKAARIQASELCNGRGCDCWMGRWGRIQKRRWLMDVGGRELLRLMGGGERRGRAAGCWDETAPKLGRWR